MFMAMTAQYYSSRTTSYCAVAAEAMAYEVARVHGLILSNIQDGDKDGGEPLPPAKSSTQMPRSSPDSPFLSDFPSELNLWSESSHSSSLESSTETETESDEEGDFIAGLAEQIAHSMLDDDEPGNASSGVDALDDRGHTSTFGRLIDEQKVPTATQLSWSPNISSSSWSDSLASSKQSSQMSSPPSTPSTSESDAWDLLNAAAGEVGRLRMNEESRPAFPVKETKLASGNVANLPNHCSPVRPQGALGPKSSVPYLVPPASSTSCSGNVRSSPPMVNTKERLMPGGAVPSHVQKNWMRFREEPLKDSGSGSVQHRFPRNDGAGWNQRQSRSANHLKGNVGQKVYRHNYNNGSHSRMSGRTMDCAAGPRPGGHGVSGGSGMRAVFLASGSGRESGGTGVFLPRCAGAGGGADHRRKPACSTVLLPSRIVQVLNLNVEDMRTHPTLSAVSPHNRNDCTGSSFRPPPQMYMMDLNSGAMKYGGDNLSTFPRKAPAAHVRQNEPAEYFLPTEWTY